MWTEGKVICSKEHNGQDPHEKYIMQLGKVISKLINTIHQLNIHIWIHITETNKVKHVLCYLQHPEWDYTYKPDKLRNETCSDPIHYFLIPDAKRDYKPPL